jgi:hypothetical protein
MNKLVTSLALVMVGTGVVRGSDSPQHRGNLEREDRTLSSRYHR